MLFNLHLRFVLIKVIEDKIYGAVEEHPPRLPLLLIQVAGIGQDVKNDSAQLKERYLRRIPPRVTDSHGQEGLPQVPRHIFSVQAVNGLLND